MVVSVVWHGCFCSMKKTLVYSAITKGYHSNPKDPHVVVSVAWHGYCCGMVWLLLQVASAAWCGCCCCGMVIAVAWHDCCYGCCHVVGVVVAAVLA